MGPVSFYGAMHRLPDSAQPQPLSVQSVQILYFTLSNFLPNVSYYVTFGLWHEPSVCRLSVVCL